MVHATKMHVSKFPGNTTDSEALQVTIPYQTPPFFLSTHYLDTRIWSPDCVRPTDDFLSFISEEPTADCGAGLWQIRGSSGV